MGAIQSASNDEIVTQGHLGSKCSNIDFSVDDLWSLCEWVCPLSAMQR